MELQTGIYGAQRQTWKKYNYRDLLKKIIENDPTLDQGQSLAAFFEEIHKPKNKKYLVSALEYAHDNAFISLCKRQKLTSEEKKVEIDKVASNIVEAAKNMVLLDMVMPNGKKLRQCTGKECSEAGGWLVQISNVIKPDEIVGDVLTEKQVRSYLK